MVVLFADHFNFPGQQRVRDDYGFIGYGELCRFIYALMMKVCSAGGLPVIHDWQEFMCKEKFVDFPRLPMDQFLSGHSFGKLLAEAKSSEGRDFRRDCYSFIVRLIELLLETTCCTSTVARGLCCFCPELLLEGDDVAVFSLYADLVGVLMSCGYLVSDVVNASIDEFRSYVVEARRHHCASGMAASDIPSIMGYLLKDFAFQSRHNLLRVFKLCCLIVAGRTRVVPDVNLEVAECQVPQEVVRSCVRIVQSFVLSEGYQHQHLFTSSTLDQVREDISGASAFMGSSYYSPWESILGDGVEEYIGHIRSRYAKHLSQKRKECDSFYEESNKVNRQLLADASSAVASTSSNLSAVMRRKKDAAKMVTVSGVKSSRGRGSVASSSRGVSGSNRGSGRAGAVRESSSGKDKKKKKKTGESDPTFTL